MAARLAARAWIGGCLRHNCRKTSLNHTQHRFCCSNHENGESTSKITVPLSQKPPGFPEPIYTTVDKTTYETKVTTLENGLRVASQKQFGQFCTVGVVIDSGSRYEVNFPSGVNHFLEKLAFTKTQYYDSKDKMHEDMEEISGICDCQGSRDTMIFALSSRTSGLPTAMNILSEAVCQPVIEDEQLNFAKSTVGFELESHRLNPFPDMLLTEMIYSAAYRNNTIGLPKLCPTDTIDSMDAKTLYTYMKLFHDPSRMVVSGTGMDHDQLVELAQKYFVDKKPIWDEKPELVDPSKGKDSSLAQYTGGIITEEADLSNASLSLTQMPEFAHFVVGLESCGHQDPDFVPFCVLNSLLGGGSSFSSGGPGKGMYTRLYTNVLNHHHWMNRAVAINQAHDETGLFTISSSAQPDIIHCLVEVIIKELIATAGHIGKEELMRAKQQLNSMMMMNLEMRPIVFEDIGRQVLATGRRETTQHYTDLIEGVEAKDIKRVAERMLRSKLSVAAYGKLERLPSLEQMQAKLLERPTLKSRIRSMF